jgi:hypothetical protein
MDLYMKHSGGSSTTMAMHYGAVQSSINLCNMLLAPVVGCLSDTIGRKVRKTPSWPKSWNNFNL